MLDVLRPLIIQKARLWRDQQHAAAGFLLLHGSLRAVVFATIFSWLHKLLWEHQVIAGFVYEALL